MLWNHCSIVGAHDTPAMGLRRRYQIEEGSEGFMTYVSLYPKAQKTFQGVPRYYLKEGKRAGTTSKG